MYYSIKNIIPEKRTEYPKFAAPQLFIHAPTGQRRALLL
jgi:hypothetical protein